MRIGVLTSSRADYGIYLPLLERIKTFSKYTLEIIAFGTHLSKYHGYTIDDIRRDDYGKIHEISSVLTNDDETSISTSYGLTCLKFSEFWSKNKYDWVLCLGDRYEMSAAVQASIPHRLRLAHIHGGETTLGAIDDIYRHQMSLASVIHFPATKVFAERIQEIIGTSKNVFPVGSLSIEAVENMAIPTEQEFRNAYNISKPYVLVTFHPETLVTEDNGAFSRAMNTGLGEVAEKDFLVITMPNADTSGTLYRMELKKLKEKHPDRVLLVENFGKLNYFAAMRYCKLLIGNTSSGIIEAASFGKYVINVGDRQKGRAQSDNVVNCAFASEEIVNSYELTSSRGEFTGDNIYHMSDTAKHILDYLNKYEKL